jgi:hypothetical protein
LRIKKEKIFLYLSIGIYIISLTQKSYCSSYAYCVNYGFLSLIFGWLGVFMLHLPAFPWLANPILVASWFLQKRNNNTSLIFSGISLGLMLSFLLVNEIIANEAGTTSKVVFYGLGYWLWVLSSFIMVLGNLLKSRNTFKSLTSK